MHDGTGAPPGRALALVEAQAEGTASPAGRPLADFLVQLIACQRRLGAYRARRRAPPETARACYEAAALPPGPRARFERKL